MISLAITAVSPHHVFPLIPPYHSLCYVSLATKYRGEFCEYYGNQASVPYITLIWKHFTSAFSHTSFSCVEANAIHFLTQPHKSQPFTIQWFNSVGSWLMRKALEGTVATCWGGGCARKLPRTILYKEARGHTQMPAEPPGAARPISMSSRVHWLYSSWTLLSPGNIRSRSPITESRCQISDGGRAVLEGRDEELATHYSLCTVFMLLGITGGS